ncbi:cell division protein SepF [Ruania suaedae]|uniref:cell division protein SepF n=1 Tax=Ruania suaedae TaxID=2897774 RepID=UPI001E390AA2|nr:cell division protein SepF [Ruania suaedae]UFU04237.1 cell division protein SepF [Ruania suaedae]
MGALRKTMLYLGLSEAEAEREERYAEEPYAEGYEPLAHEHDDDDDYTGAVQEAQVTPISQAASHSGHNLRRITTVHPRSYTDAKSIGEAFRAGTPVIMNLTDMSDAEAKRLVDFSAGLIFGLHGSIERVTNKVFLLSPATVEVASERREPETTARFFNQS